MEVAIEAFWKPLEHYGTPQQNTQLLQRTLDTLWKSAITPDTQLQKPAMISVRSALTDNEKWKLQAAVRREETKGAGKEYNKKVTRAMRMATGPSTDGSGAFPPGRGRPVR